MALSQAQLEHFEFLIGKRNKDTELPLPPIQNHGEAIFPSPHPRDYEDLSMTKEEIAEWEEKQYRSRL